jgi:type IX secretion system PorP/SprF family membrane protein
LHQSLLSYRSRLTGLLLILQLVSLPFAVAQEPVFSQFMFNQVVFNPAFAGNTPYPRLVAGYRNQWPGLGNSFVSYYASFDQFVKKINGGVAIGMTRDQQGAGVFSSTSLDAMYSHTIELWRDSKVNLGVQGSLVQKSVSTSGVTLSDQSPYQTSGTQEYIPGESFVYPDFATGVSFEINEQYQANFSLHHINSPKQIFGVSSPISFNAQLTAIFPNKEHSRRANKVTYHPGVMLQRQKTFNYVSWGSSIGYGQLLGGLWFRNNASLGMNTFIFQAGYVLEGLTISYSYDLWLPKNDQHLLLYGSHEVTFVYLFQYNDPKKKMREVKCPKFY